MTPVCWQYYTLRYFCFLTSDFSGKILSIDACLRIVPRVWIFPRSTSQNNYVKCNINTKWEPPMGVIHWSNLFLLPVIVILISRYVYIHFYRWSARKNEEWCEKGINSQRVVFVIWCNTQVYISYLCTTKCQRWYGKSYLPLQEITVPVFYSGLCLIEYNYMSE